MQALILNSGMGSRMGSLTRERHKSMVEIAAGLPLIIYQISTLAMVGVTDFIITTGYMQNKLINLVEKHFGNKYKFEFVFNPKYQTTNYIYSIFLAIDKIKGDLFLLHGDLFFTKEILEGLLNREQSAVVVDNLLLGSKKDFKAIVYEERVMKIATNICNPASVSCQPLYKLKKVDWSIWAEAIQNFCYKGKTNVYAEEALNVVLDDFMLWSFDVQGELCMEVDTLEDLVILKSNIEEKGYIV